MNARARVGRRPRSRVAETVAFALALLPMLGCEVLANLGEYEFTTVAEGADAVSPPATPTADASLSPPLDGDAASGDDDEDDPWCVPSANMLAVHAAFGDDAAGDGSCDRPFRSITKGLQVAREAIDAQTVFVGGGTEAAPLVYSPATTNEAFPIRLDSPGLRLTGSDPRRAVITGEGACSGVGPCAVFMQAPGTRLAGLMIDRADGHGVGITASSVVIEDVIVRRSSAAGIRVSGSAVIRRTLVTESAENGLSVGRPGGGEVTIMESEVVRNRFAGLRVFNEGRVTSTRTKYALNSVGAELMHNATFASVDDIFDENSSHGLVVGERLSAVVTARLTNARVSDNGSAGIVVTTAGSLRARGTMVRANRSHGIEVLVGARSVDLGSQEEVGVNALNPPTAPNLGSGVCNRGEIPVLARGNSYRACPPATATSGCPDGTDLGSANAQSPIDAAGCVPP
jgi:hypothetical protein